MQSYLLELFPAVSYFSTCMHILQKCMSARYYISPTVRGVDPAEISQASYSGGASILHKLVGDLCKQILRLMECSTEQETEDVIQAGFELWKEVLHFTYPEGTIVVLL